jgi:uncharacterized protein DUF6644
MLQGFFEAMGQWPISQAIGASIWIYPLVQAVHLVFLAFFAGGIIIVDLRLLGYGMRSKPISQVARDARPWMIMMQNATREYFSEFFWYKMYLLAFGLIFLVTVRRKMTQAAESSTATKVVGLISMVIWTGVTINARLIGLFT